MENHFNTPAEVIDLSIKACENKTKLPVGNIQNRTIFIVKHG